MTCEHKKALQMEIKAMLFPLLLLCLPCSASEALARGLLSRAVPEPVGSGGTVLFGLLHIC